MIDFNMKSQLDKPDCNTFYVKSYECSLSCPAKNFVEVYYVHMKNFAVYYVHVRNVAVYYVHMRNVAVYFVHMGNVAV